MPVTLRGFGAESVFLSLYKITETPLWLQGGDAFPLLKGGGPRVVVINTAFHARARGSFPSLGSLKETQMFLPHPLIKLSIVGSLRHREVACLASELQSLDFKSCVWRTISSHLSHHAQEVLLAQFSLYVHKSGLKPDSFHFPLVKSSWRYCNSGSFFCCRRRGCTDAVPVAISAVNDAAVDAAATASTAAAAAVAPAAAAAVVTAAAVVAAAAASAAASAAAVVAAAAVAAAAAAASSAASAAVAGTVP